MSQKKPIQIPKQKFRKACPNCKEFIFDTDEYGLKNGVAYHKKCFPKENPLVEKTT